MALARISDAFLRGKMYHGNSAPTATRAGKASAFLAPFLTVTIGNVKESMIKDGYVKASNVPQCHV